MSRRSRFGVVALVAATVLAGAVPARAAGPDPYERQQRRQELRQQLEAERERWRAEGHGGGHPRSGSPHGFAPHGPGGGPPPGHGARLSPEERRALREALREHRP